MFCALLTSRYQVSVYRTNGPLVFLLACQDYLNHFEPIYFALHLHDLKMTDHTVKILTVANVKSLPWKHGMITNMFFNNIFASFI